MFNVKSLLLIFIMITSGVAQESLSGVYLTEDGSTQMEVFEQEGMVYGKVKHSTKQQAPVGELVLIDFVREGAKWEGKLHAIAKGKYFDASLRKRVNGLEITIYQGRFKKTVVWSRVGNDMSIPGDV